MRCVGEELETNDRFIILSTLVTYTLYNGVRSVSFTEFQTRLGSGKGVTISDFSAMYRSIVCGIPVEKSSGSLYLSMQCY